MDDNNINNLSAEPNDESNPPQSAQRSNTAQPNPRPNLLISYSKEITLAVIIGVIITVFSTIILNYIYPENENDIEVNAHAGHYQQYISQAQNTTTQPNYREYLIRSNLSNVMASLAPAKTQIHMYFQMNGEFPKDGGDINLSSFDLAEHDLIKSSFLVENGGIGANLSDTFGEEKFLILQAKSSKNGAFIKWQCFTNVDEQYLGLPKNRNCEFKNTLD